MGAPVSGKIRVCHLASGDRWAGAEVQIATLLKQLTRSGEIELSAIFLNDGRLAEEVRRASIETLVIPEGKAGFLHILRRATKFLRPKGIQILHSHRYKENLLAAFLTRRCGIPVWISTRHGLKEPFCWGLRSLKQSLILGIDRFLLRSMADRVVGVSSEVAQHLRGFLGFDKVVTIRNGVDTESVRSRLTISEAKERLGIAPASVVMGAVGRLEAVKRLDIFLKAAQLISNHTRNADFVVAGDGSQRSALEQLARQLGIADRVHFLGHRDDAFDVLRALDILVLSSDHEGLPMVVLEALTLGVVVISRRVGGIPEVIDNQATGILVESESPSDLADACVRVLSDEACRRRIADAGRNHVIQNFDAARTVSRIIGLYREVFASS